MKRKLSLILLIMVFVCFNLNGCKSEESDKKQVVFLNNLMTISDKLSEYEKDFEALHPDIDIRIESIGDQYENISVTRLNAGNAGDVMIIPSYMSVSYYPDYYEPLYSVGEGIKKYRFSNIKSVNDNVYSIPLSMNISGGILYDMRVLNDAGIQKAPESLEELKEALKSVKDKTEAVPLFSNARGGSELTCWNSLVYTLCGNPNYNENIIKKENPFLPDSEYYNVYKFLYECVDEDLIEDSFVSSTWDDGIKLLKEGKLAAAVISLDMYKEAEKEALNSKSLVYVPLKSNNDEYYLYGEPSYGIGINKESNNKEEAYIWLEYLLDDTDFLEYAGDSGMLGKNPQHIYEEDISRRDITMIYPDANVEESMIVFEKIDNEACLGIYGGSFVFNLINEAASGDTDYDKLCDEWNIKWNSALWQINKSE